MKYAAAALALALALAACADKNSLDDEPMPTLIEPSSPSVSESPPEAQTTSVGVVVVTINVLDQRCEALSGVYRGLHTGATVLIQDESGDVVGTGQLGDPPTAPAKWLCSWGADVEATLAPDEPYRARVAGRFTSRFLLGSRLEGERLVLQAQ